MVTKSMFENIKRGKKWSSSKSPSIQVLHQQIRGGGGSGVLDFADSANAGRGSKNMENMLT